MSRVALCLLAIAACGKGGDKTANDKPAGGTASANPSVAPPAGKKGVAGEIHLSGALTGTFTWKDDLAIDGCGWVDSVKVGNLEVTMSDGKDTFIAVGATLHDNGKKTAKLSGGKLKLPHAGMLQGEGGFEMSGTDSGDDSTITVVFKNTPVSADGQTVTIDGTLAGNCKYSR